MLKVGGENVAASEIERVVSSVAGVAECAVVAKRDPMLDEVPVVFVLPPANSTVDIQQLSADVLAKCQAALADFKVPPAKYAWSTSFHDRPWTRLRRPNFVS